MNPIEPAALTPPPAAPMGPALYNPNAAALWSILLSPVFGGWLHGKNWLALGEPAKAKLSRQWAYGTLAVLLLSTLLSVFFPDAQWLETLSRPMGIALLVSWWFSIGKEQYLLVKTRYGTNYPRRSLWGPLGYALLVVIAYAIAVVVLGALFGVIGGLATPTSGGGRGPVL